MTGSNDAVDKVWQQIQEAVTNRDADALDDLLGDLVRAGDPRRLCPECGKPMEYVHICN